MATKTTTSTTSSKTNKPKAGEGMDTNREMWLRFRVTLQVDGPFGASIPKTPDEIRAMLENRMPGKMPDGATPIGELVEQVIEEVGASDEFLPGGATFKRDAQGLYYEGRNVRGHLKDCALQVAPFFPAIGAFRAKVANKTYVETDRIVLGKAEPDGTIQRFIQVMTRQGPRSSIKYVDYIENPKLVFVMRLLNDGVVTEKVLRRIFEYGGTHGIGAERSQGWGRYTLEGMEAL